MSKPLAPLKVKVIVRDLKTNRAQSVLLENADKTVTVGITDELAEQYAPVLAQATQLLEACKAFVAKLNAEGLAHYPLLKEQYEAAVAAIAAAEQEY